MRGRRHVREIELADLRDGGEDVVQLRAEAVDLVLAQLEARESSDVQQLFTVDVRHLEILPEKRKRPLSGPLHYVGPTGSLNGLDVRGLRALRALHNLKRHALAFGQRLVAVHADRRKMAQPNRGPLPLEEGLALLLRKPLFGALFQPWFLLTATTTARAPESRARRPMMKQAGV